MLRSILFATTLLLAIGALEAAPAAPETARRLRREFPRLDLSRSAIAPSELTSGGPPRDGIPAIDAPRRMPAAMAAAALGRDEPVVTVAGACGAVAYPFRILIWHEIVNDRICGRPIAVTYCPLCNTAMVFERTLDGRLLSFGTTGRLRHSDLVMYDRETETFWQQFTGQSLMGMLHPAQLVSVPARIESVAAFQARHPLGHVLAPPGGGRPYGRNPYVGYDRAPAPFLYKGRMPVGVAPMERVVRVGDRAWTLSLVRRKRLIVTPDRLRIAWTEGQNSALDSARIDRGRDIGNVTVTQDGADVAYSVDFAFAFSAFYPQSRIEK